MAMSDAPKGLSRMECLVNEARSKSEDAWSFFRRAKLIRENLLGCSTEPPETAAKGVPATGVVCAIEDGFRNTKSAFDALHTELEQIKKCLGL